MSHYQTIQSLGTPIVVHSGITQMLGSMTASALLSHIMYWSERTDNPLGFYRTLDELKAETSLSDNELRTARKLLVKLGLVTETHKRLEHRLYFKFNAQVFDKLFGEHLAKCENPHLASCEIHNPPPVKSTTGELLNPQLGSSENHSSLYTKITTKNTTKITDKECVGGFSPTPTPKACNKKSNPTDCPDNFVFTKSQIDKCNQHGFDIHLLFETFKNNHKSKGHRFVCWSSAFNTWINNEIKWKKPTNNQNTNQAIERKEELDRLIEYMGDGFYGKVTNQIGADNEQSN